MIVGTLIVSASFHQVEDMFIEDEFLSLGVPRFFASYGGLLLVVPLTWVVLTIRAERSSVWWASTAFSTFSGIALLLALAGLFGWVALSTASLPFNWASRSGGSCLALQSDVAPPAMAAANFPEAAEEVEADFVISMTSFPPSPRAIMLALP
ncbi:MAG: hypothetical protein B9S38_03700 [Verrucomicrobiia bacterium Tous-C4TDCM]|nr:MAG: hypothetical protein B9S38_03700 [Verrucomicrobiae bacterium Tous-C4TDCM]